MTGPTRPCRGRVLITGGAGFIGCALARRLVADGWTVSVFDNLHPQVHPGGGRPARLSEDVRLLVGDVTRPEDWATVLALSRPDTLVHVAAETATGQSLTQASRHGLVNVVGTTRLTDALLSSGAQPGHIVLASSRAVYGEGPWQVGQQIVHPPARAAEDLAAGRWEPRLPEGPARPLPAEAGQTPTSPTSVYGATKLAQEHLLGSWCRAYRVPLSVLRLQNVYGPGQALSNSYTGALAHFAVVAAAGDSIDVYEDGRIVRDFIFIDDAVAAFVAAIDRPPAADATRLLDIGSGTASTIADVAAQVAQWWKAPAPHISGNYRHGDVRASCCRIGDAQRELGWTPAWSLGSGLPALLGWVREEIGARLGRASGDEQIEDHHGKHPPT